MVFDSLVARSVTLPAWTVLWSRTIFISAIAGFGLPLIDASWSLMLTVESSARAASAPAKESAAARPAAVAIRLVVFMMTSSLRISGIVSSETDAGLTVTAPLWSTTGFFASGHIERNMHAPPLRVLRAGGRR